VEVAPRQAGRVVGEFDGDHGKRFSRLRRYSYIVTYRVDGDGDGRRGISTLVHGTDGLVEELLRVMVRRAFGGS
jgi:hypothetical protein